MEYLAEDDPSVRLYREALREAQEPPARRSYFHIHTSLEQAEGALSSDRTIPGRAYLQAQIVEQQAEMSIADPETPRASVPDQFLGVSDRSGALDRPEQDVQQALADLMVGTGQSRIHRAPERETEIADETVVLYSALTRLIFMRARMTSLRAAYISPDGPNLAETNVLEDARKLYLQALDTSKRGSEQFIGTRIMMSLARNEAMSGHHRKAQGWRLRALVGKLATRDGARADAMGAIISHYGTQDALKNREFARSAIRRKP